MNPNDLNQPNQNPTPPQPQPNTPPPLTQPAQPSTPPQPVTSPAYPSPPSHSNKTLIIVLCAIGGAMILLLLVVIIIGTMSGAKRTTNENTTTAPSASSNSESSTTSSLPNGYVPINTNCYRAAAPTNHELSNDNACYIHVYYGSGKSNGYMVARMIVEENSQAVSNWKKSNPYKVVSEEPIIIGGLAGTKIVYNRNVGSKSTDGAIVFVATPGKGYKDGSFDIDGLEISTASYNDDADNSKQVFDTVLQTWQWK